MQVIVRTVPEGFEVEEKDGSLGLCKERGESRGGGESCVQDREVK